MNQKIRKIVTNDPVFQCTFMDWLMDKQNYKVWLRFRRLAEKMQCRRDSYSARTIVEILRWQTDLSDSDVVHKINNNCIPDLARLFNKVTKSKFFNERKLENSND